MGLDCSLQRFLTPIMNPELLTKDRDAGRVQNHWEDTGSTRPYLTFPQQKQKELDWS